LFFLTCKEKDQLLINEYFESWTQELWSQLWQKFGNRTLFLFEIGRFRSRVVSRFQQGTWPGWTKDSTKDEKHILSCVNKSRKIVLKIQNGATILHPKLPPICWKYQEKKRRMFCL
jgi:hypothetical protein